MCGRSRFLGRAFRVVWEEARSKDGRSYARNEKKLPGIGKLLFETPSGFAVFSFLLEYLHEDIEHIWHYFVGDYWHNNFLWLHDFQKFEDKSNAINITTREIDGNLTRMLWDYCLPEEVIVVGRPEYKSIIKEKLRRNCVYNERVMEVMWGMQNLLPILIPQEQSKFTKADRLPICKGLDMVLSRHGIDMVKREMVYHADLREKEHSRFLHSSLDKDLKAISGFDAKDWDSLFSAEELALIIRDAPKYEDLIDRATISKIYNDIVALHAYVVKVLLKLRHLVKKAEAALKTEDVLEKATRNGADSMQQVDHTCLAVDLVEVPQQSSIGEEQQCHIIGENSQLLVV
nr:nucleolar protein 58-like [Aegilops tauschii subsp. strangulata]